MALEIGFIVAVTFGAVALAGAVMVLLSRKSIASRSLLRQVVSIPVAVAIVSSIVLFASSQPLDGVLQTAAILAAVFVFGSTVYVQRRRSVRIQYLSDLAHLSQMIADLIAGGSDIGLAVSRSLELNGSQLGLDGVAFDSCVRAYGLEKALLQLAGDVDETSLHVLVAHLLVAVRTGSSSVQSAAVGAADQAQLAIELELEQLLGLSSHQFELRALSLLIIIGVPAASFVIDADLASIDPTLYLSVVGLITLGAGIVSVWLGLRPFGNSFSLNVSDLERSNG